METNVIQMPKTRLFRKIFRDRFHERKASVAVSLAAVLVLSLFMNQWLVAPGSTAGLVNGGGRGIASVGDSARQESQQIAWEQVLVEQISKGTPKIAHLSERPSLRDELLFGVLEGRYGVQFEKGKVIGLEFNNSSTNGEAVIVADAKKLIENYRGVWALEFARAELQEKTDGKSVFQLLSADNSKVGMAHLDQDPAGHIISLKISK